jgi:hypothetical protein
VSAARLSTSTSRERVGAILKPVDTDLVVVSTIVNALRTLEGEYQVNGFVNTKSRRLKVMDMAMSYLRLDE